MKKKTNGPTRSKICSKKNKKKMEKAPFHGKNALTEPTIHSLNCPFF